MGLPGSAQETTVKGNLGGVVADSSGAVIPGAKVTLSGPVGTLTTTSDNQGNFLFVRLAPGSYALKVEKEGFKAADVKGVEVSIGRTASLNLRLEPGAISEVVEVSANAVAVDTTSTTTGSNLSDTFYQSVPVPRNVSGLFYVAPGVADSGGAGRANPSVSGGSGLENLYVADGVNITDPAFGGLGIFTRQYGSVGSGINLSFIKEVQVKTGGFEPQYGVATGGVVQIVTKSGSEHFHGAVGAFYAPVEAAATPKNVDTFRNQKFGTNAFVANANPFISGTQPGLYAGPGGWDAAAEIGGYVPGLRNRLFFFGSYNPTLLVDYNTPPLFAGSPAFFGGIIPPPVGLFTQLGGRPIYTRAFTQNYAAKLTLKIGASQTLESSVFGDPTSTNAAAFRSLTAQNTTVFSKQNYQTRNWVVRYNGTVSPSWLVNMSFTWNHNEFTENPQNPGVFNVVNQTSTGLSPTLQGLGFIEDHNAENFGYSADTSKVVRFVGQHTLQVGFSQAFLNYNNIKARTGGRFPVPDLGPARNEAVYGCAAATGDPTCPLGFPMNAQFSLIARTLTPGPTQCTTCPLFTTLSGETVPVALSISRAEFGPPLAATEGLGYAAWVNDNWMLNKHLSFSLGLRWEQYTMTGVSSHYTFTDNWAPRLGVIYDPWGDRKTKIFLNWARYNYQMPLDAAIRSLSSEFDLTGLRFAPESVGGRVVVNTDGSINVVTDAAHVLNANGGGPGAGTGATASIQAGEGFAAGTKMQYENEYVAGIERDLGKGFILSARYIDRRLGRVVEDMSGVSPEAFLSTSPLNQIYLIGNPNSSLDLFTNVPNPLVQPQGAACASGNVSINDANGFPFASGQQACFPANVIGVNGQLGGSPIPDGLSDGFANPVRKYQAAEFELNKGFSSGWLMRFNYRLAYLRGNYEGAFRNDNGQTDPSISSLFDFTTGVMGLLGDQFAIGPLNTERHQVANLFVSYTFDRSKAKGLTLGTGMRVFSGTPVSEFANHPAYGNQGEVPIGGRGSLGRTPISGGIDMHAEYARKLTERLAVHMSADLFNITNSMPTTLIDQNRDLSFQAPFSNTDFRTTLNFQNPFYARFGLKFQF
jgi:hypothetical protein